MSVRGRLTRTWAQFASELEYERLPAALVASTKGLLLDTIGVSLAASTLGEGCKQVVAMVRANPGAAEATLLGYGDRVSSLLAAFGNGALAHALNFDANGAAGGHLGLASIPATLVMAERRGQVDGRELITSIAAAAEFTARLAAALRVAGVDANEKFLEGQLLGYFGAAIGAGRVLRFTPAQMHSLLGLALMQAAGSRQVSFEGGAAKAIYGAYCNHGAVMAASLAEHGIDAACDAIEGRAGMYSLFYAGKYDAATLIHDLGKRYYATDVVFKPWATSEMLHPFMEACVEIRGKLDLDASRIRAVVVRAGTHAKPWFEPLAERRRPPNAATAANSIFFGVAKTLLHGNVSLADFTPDGLQEPATLALAERIDYLIDDRVGSGAEVTVTMQDDSTVSAGAGERRPILGYDQLATKFRDCARYTAHPIPPAVVEETIERIDRLEQVTEIADLLARLHRKPDLQ